MDDAEFYVFPKKQGDIDTYKIPWHCGEQKYQCLTNFKLPGTLKKRKTTGVM